MEVVEDESRPHKAVSFVAKREKEIQEWNEQKLPKVLPGCSEGRLPWRSAKDRGREEEEEGKDSRERQVRYEIAQEVVAGITEKKYTKVVRRLLVKNFRFVQRIQLAASAKQAG